MRDKHRHAMQHYLIAKKVGALRLMNSLCSPITGVPDTPAKQIRYARALAIYGKAVQDSPQYRIG